MPAGDSTSITTMDRPNRAESRADADPAKWFIDRLRPQPL
jgi:hypothetical protein